MKGHPIEHSGDFKRRFGGKARILRGDDVESITGHPVGGVCPFANPTGTRVFLDESLRRFDTVFPAAGTITSAVQLTLSDLEQLSAAAGWVDICTAWSEDAQRAHNCRRGICFEPHGTPFDARGCRLSRRSWC